jgi:hypothetical protein
VFELLGLWNTAVGCDYSPRLPDALRAAYAGSGSSRIRFTADLASHSRAFVQFCSAFTLLVFSVIHGPIENAHVVRSRLSPSE